MMKFTSLDGDDASNVMFHWRSVQTKKKTPRKSHLTNGEVMGHRPMFDAFWPIPGAPVTLEKM